MKYRRVISLRVVHGSHPARGAWIEILSSQSFMPLCPSHPARGAWIEISPLLPLGAGRKVAPRKGCVD